MDGTCSLITKPTRWAQVSEEVIPRFFILRLLERLSNVGYYSSFYSSGFSFCRSFPFPASSVIFCAAATDCLIRFVGQKRHLQLQSSDHHLLWIMTSYSSLWWVFQLTNLVGECINQFQTSFLQNRFHLTWTGTSSCITSNLFFSHLLHIPCAPIIYFDYDWHSDQYFRNLLFGLPHQVCTTYRSTSRL